MRARNIWNYQKIIGAVFALSLFLFPHTLFAAFSVTLTPAVIDGEVKAREILRYKVTITNDTKQMLTLYPWARDVDMLGEDTKTQGLDPTTSLLSWLQFSRAELDIQPGASVDLPVLVQVNLRARPGVYHAVLHVSDGPNRVEAEANREKTVSLMLNIRVLDDANERLQLGAFATDKNLFIGDNATFGFRLDNTGNRGIIPTGKIRIFDRKGEQVDVVEINNTGDRIEPEKKQQLASVWQSGSHFGKYKAMLDVSYGKTGTIQDTVFFWVLPWKKLLSFFLTIAIICTVLALLFHSYTTSGGRKLALVRGGPSRDEDKEEDDGAERGKNENEPEAESGRVSIFGRMLLLWKRNALAAIPVIKKEAYIDALKEVEHPRPQRTRHSAFTPHSSAAPLQLASRVKKMEIDPAHILQLKKK